MLIDTNQIVPKTDFRHNLNLFIEKVREGETFVISDRGLIVAVVSPSSKLDAHDSTETTELLSETIKLAEKIDAKTASKWNSLTALKKNRKQRLKYLRKN